MQEKMTISPDRKNIIIILLETLLIVNVNEE